MLSDPVSFRRILPQSLIFAAICATALPALSQTVISYDYDVLGQLTGRTVAAGPDTLYGYDGAGNRLTLDVSGAPGGVAPGAPRNAAPPMEPAEDLSAPACSPVSGCAAE